MAPDPVGAEVVVSARGLGLDGGRGPVYLPIDLDVAAGSLHVLAGPAGSGRTSLLLTVAGRMTPTAGRLTVAGYHLPRHRGAVQCLVTLATLHGVNDLDGALTVEEHVLERLALSSPWWRLLTPSTADVPGVLAAVDEPAHPGLDPDALVRDLTPYDRFRLGIALALADRARRHPRVLVVDDVDDLRDPDALDRAWHLLYHLAGSDAEPAEPDADVGTEPDADRALDVDTGPAPDVDTRPEGGGVPGGLAVLASCTAAGTLPDDVRLDERTVVRRMGRRKETVR